MYHIKPTTLNFDTLVVIPILLLHLWNLRHRLFPVLGALVGKGLSLSQEVSSDWKSTRT